MNAVELYQDDEMHEVSRHFEFVPQILSRQLLEIIDERYENYVEYVYFTEKGQEVPSALDILVLNLAEHPGFTPFDDFIFECIAQNQHETYEDWPAPWSEGWGESHEAACGAFMEGAWEHVQANFVHDMDLMFRMTGYVILNPATRRVVNQPVIEVW